MVWALIEPNGFGDFFPGGDYKGWRERLREYATANMSPEEKAAYYNFPASYVQEVADKFTREVGTQLGDSPAVTPLLPREQPVWFETRKSFSNLGSLIMLTNGLLAVDAAFREILERLEPGVHMFWPLTITMPRGRVYPKPYYGMVIGTFLDSFEPGMSAEGSCRKEKGFDSYFVSYQSKKYISGLAFSKEKIGGAHLWRERRLRSPDICFSDDLRHEVARAGLRIPKHVQAREV